MRGLRSQVDELKRKVARGQMHDSGLLKELIQELKSARTSSEAQPKQ